MQKRKHYVLPAFTEPFVSALTTNAPVAGQGCRLEPNSLYVRSWKSGTVGGQYGTSGTVTFTFDTSAQGWVSSAVGRWLGGNWDSTNGNPSGCMTGTLAADIRNRPGTGTFSWTGTWIQLGVPSGSVVTTAQLVSAYDYAPVVYDSDNLGPYEIYDSTNTTSIAQLCALRNISVADSGWVNRSGTAQTIPSAYQSASTTITLRNTFSGDCGSGVYNYIMMDQLTYVMGYM